MHRMLKSRSGFTLVEALIAMLLTAIIGAAALGVFVTQSRFYSHQEKASFARSASRGTINLMMSELRMVERLGAFPFADSVTTTKVRVRVPYRFGIVCKAGVNTAAMVALLMPEDTTFSASGEAAHGGHAWRSSAGAYTYIKNSTITAGAGADATACANEGVQTGAVTGSAIRRLSNASGTAGTPGQPVFLYREITYHFAAASDFGGQLALWRTVHGSGKPAEIIAGPFDVSSGFQYYVDPALTLTSVNPSASADVRGLMIKLNVVADPTPGTDQQVLPYSTSVFFRNTL